MSVLPVRALVHAAVAASAALSGAQGTPTTTAAHRFELTFRVIDRTGHLVSPLDLQLLNLASGTNIDVGQRSKARVTSGRYNIAVWIPTGSGAQQSFTLADQIVRVTRSRTIALAAPRVEDELIELAPIVKGQW